MLKRIARRVIRRARRHGPPVVDAALDYRERHGRLPRLWRPRLFTEHLYAKKLWGDHASFVPLTDKVLAKEHVARVLGPDWVVPTLWHGPALPPRAARDWPRPFVLKANHGSGMNHFVWPDEEPDWDRIEAKAAEWTTTDWPHDKHEEWYNRIERQLMVEPVLGGTRDLPMDYKFFVFGGQALFVRVITDRFGEEARAIFDRDWNRLPFWMRADFPPVPMPRPEHLDAMLDAAEALAAGHDFLRVDFYNLPEGPRFGEITIAPEAGHIAFQPEGWDAAIGALWRRRPTDPLPW